MPASSGRSANACGPTVPGSPRIVIRTSAWSGDRLEHGLERRRVEAHREAPVRERDREVRWRARRLLGADRLRPGVTEGEQPEPGDRRAAPAAVGVARVAPARPGPS